MFYVFEENIQNLYCLIVKGQVLQMHSISRLNLQFTAAAESHEIIVPKLLSNTDFEYFL